MYWIIGAAAAGLLVLGASYFTYRLAFYSAPKGRENISPIPSGKQYQGEKARIVPLIQELEAIPFEEVTITSRDGLRLSGRYYHVRDGAPLEIECHGYRGHALRDFCGGNKISREAGFNTLLIDQRAHGKSEGVTITMGVKERYDCLDWVLYAVDRFGPEQKILLSGVSMGAATVLMASDLPLPPNVVGIVADCPYSSPEKIVRKVCRDAKLPPTLAYPFLSLGARLFGRFRLWEASAEEAVRNSKVPILLIHGESDHFVPCEMSREIYDACTAPKRLLTVPGAGHGISYLVDTETYVNTVHEFVNGLLAEQANI